MADFNLIDALHESTPSVESEIKRDFIASLEAEKYDDVVGESVMKESYVPLLDDERKSPPSEAKENAVVHLYGETAPKQEPDGGQLAERSGASKQGPGKLPNGEHGVGQADGTEIHKTSFGVELLSFGGTHFREGAIMEMMSQSAQMSTEPPFSLLGTREGSVAEELFNFEPMLPPVRGTKGATTSCPALQHLNSPAEVTVTEPAGNLVAEVKSSQKEAARTELPPTPAQEHVEAAQEVAEEFGVPFTGLNQVETSFHPVDHCDPALSSAGLMDDYLLVSNMTKTTVAVAALLQTPTNHTPSAPQWENLGRDTGIPVFTELFPPTCGNFDLPMGAMVLTNTTTTTTSVADPLIEAPPLERPPGKDKPVEEVTEITQTIESQVVKVAVEKKKKKKKRSHPKGAQVPVVDVQAKAKEVQGILSDQRIEGLSAGGTREHKGNVLSTEGACKQASGGQVKAQQVDSVPNQSSIWVSGSAESKMARPPLHKTKTPSGGHEGAAVGSQRREAAHSDSQSRVEATSETEWTEHPLDYWSREIISSESHQIPEVEEVAAPPLERWGVEITPPKSQKKSEVNEVALTPLELGGVDNIPPKSKEAPEIKEMEGPYLEHAGRETASPGSKQTSEVNEMVEILLEHGGREITPPGSQESSEVKEVAQTPLKHEGRENTSPEFQQTSEVKEMTETLIENAGRETTPLESKKVPEVKEIEDPSLEHVARQTTPLESEQMSEVMEMAETPLKLVGREATPLESKQTSEVKEMREIPLDHVDRETGPLGSKQTSEVTEMAETPLEHVNRETGPLESKQTSEVKEMRETPLDHVDRETGPLGSKQTSEVMEMIETPLDHVDRETGPLGSKQTSEVTEMAETPLEHVSRETGPLESKQISEVTEMAETPLDHVDRETGPLWSKQTSEVTEMAETPLEHASTETTPPDLQDTSEVERVVETPLDHCCSEITSFELQQKFEIKDLVESPLECWNRETAPPESQQTSEVKETVESPLECRDEVIFSECTDRVTPPSLKHEAPKLLNVDEGKSSKAPLKKGGAKFLQKRGFTKGASQREAGAKVSPEQHRAPKASTQPKGTKAPNQRQRGDVKPLEPEEIGNINAQSDQQGHLEEGPRQDEAKPEEPSAEGMTRTESAATSKEHPLSPDTKGKAGTPATKISPTKTKPQPPASLKRPTATAPSPNKKLTTSTSTTTAASTSKRLSSSLVRPPSATTKDMKPKTTEAKSPVKLPSSRPSSAGVTKTSSNTTIKSSTTSLQKSATTTGSTQRNTTLSTPKRPTSIKTDPKSTEAKKSLSAKSPLGETGRPKTASTASIKSTGTTPSTPSTPLGMGTPGTPLSNTSRTPRTLALKTTAASEAKRVAPIPRTPSKPTVAAAPKQPRPTSAPAPDLKNIKSKIGSTDNIKYQPGGGKAKPVEKRSEPVRLNRKAETSTVTRVSKTTTTKDSQKQTNGKVQIPKTKVDMSRAPSKCGSKTNLKHKAGSGDVKIETVKVDFKNKAESKIGSLDNLNHTPGGGNTKNEGEEESESATISQIPENGDLTGQAESGTRQNGVGEDPTARSDETHSQELQIQEIY